MKFGREKQAKRQSLEELRSTHLGRGGRDGRAWGAIGKADTLMPPLACLLSRYLSSRYVLRLMGASGEAELSKFVPQYGVSGRQALE